MKKILLSLFLLISATASFSQVKITAKEAPTHMGDSVELTDQVYGGKLLNNGMTLLNLGEDFPNHLVTVVIKAEDRSKFSGKPEEELVGKTVRIMGKIEEYKGKPQIIIVSPNQISLMPNIKTPAPVTGIAN
ncbi:hypothetical protein GZH53_09965 [Flavihumibacter sp. R14]|nr:hypothetical protein [Flavihumibacter soli]